MGVLVILVICGLFTNLLSAVFGVGGGIIVVPVLRYLFPDAPVQSIAATSLMVVMLGSLVNIILFHRYKIKINRKKLLIWSVAMLIGVQVGFYLIFLLSDRVIMLCFALTLILLALKTLLDRRTPRYDTNKPDTLMGTVLCSLGGMVAGLTGLGGGSVLAPLVSQLPSIRRQEIAVYTNWMMFIGGFGSTLSYLSLKMAEPAQAMGRWQVGYVNFYVVGIIFVSALLMSHFSMQLRGILSERLSKNLFAGLLVAIALFIFTTL